MAERKQSEGGQATTEFVIAYAGVLFPLTFAVIFTSQLLWIWHGVNDFTRRGAGYAATHCCRHPEAMCSVTCTIIFRR